VTGNAAHHLSATDTPTCTACMAAVDPVNPVVLLARWRWVGPGWRTCATCRPTAATAGVG
jgi:hypothetical protein